MTVIRLCIACATKVSLSIAGLGEIEFKDKIFEKSGCMTDVTYVSTNKHKEKLNDNFICLKKFDFLPLILSYLLICLLNIKIFLKQDIIIVPTIGLEGLFACIFGKLFSKKTMITVHGHYEAEWKNIRHYSKINICVRHLMETVILNLVDMLVVNDESLRVALIKKGVEPQRILIRYVFVDTQIFSRDNINKDILQDTLSRFGLPENYILFVGRLDEWDGIMDLLEAFLKIRSIFSSYKLAIVGVSEIDLNIAELNIKSFITKNCLKDNLIFTGKVDHNLMPYIYHNASLIILPMRPPQAGVGRIILESLAMRLPVITSDIGIFHRVVINEVTGFRVPVGNIDLIAEKAIYLIKNPDIAKQLGLNGRRLVEFSYNLEKYMDNWTNSIKLLNKK